MSTNPLKLFENLLELEKSTRRIYDELLKKLSNEDIKYIITSISELDERHMKLVEEAITILQKNYPK